MKKLLLIGSALTLLSSSAFASQSRLLALGMNETDNEGSYYIKDSRNIFLNPAYVNIFSDFATLEWGSTGSNASILATESAATLSTTTSPKAQGGAFKKYGDMVFGIYFGNESNTSSLLRVAGSSAIASVNGITNTTTFAGTNSKMLQSADNQVDFFVGGGSDLKWAANATLAKGEDETRNSKDSAAAIRGGVIAANWDAHLNVSLNSEAEASESITAAALGVAATTVSQKFEGKLGFHTGGSYALNDFGRVFGYVKHYGWEQTDSFTYSAPVRAAIGGQTGKVEGDFTSYYIGWGKEFEVNETDKLFTSLTAKKTDINLELTNKSEVRHLIVPVTIGYEARATDWLVLRGSVVQNLYGTRDNKGLTNLNPVARTLIGQIYGTGNGKKTIANSTTVNAGATLTFGQLAVDGLFGTTAASRAGTTGNATNAGVLSLDNLQSSVALTYKF